MKPNNPLEILGISQEVLRRERSTRNFKNIQKIAEGAYKNLAKIYHPDKLTGDAVFMAQLTEAYEKLSEISAVEGYVNDLLSTSEMLIMREKKVKQELTMVQQSIALINLNNLVEIFIKESQFSLLDISNPTSFLCFKNGSSMVINVYEPKQASVTTALNSNLNIQEKVEFKFKKGKWLFSEEGKDQAALDAAKDFAEFKDEFDLENEGYKFGKKEKSNIWVDVLEASGSHTRDAEIFVEECCVIGFQEIPIHKAQPTKKTKSSAALAITGEALRLRWTPLEAATFLSETQFMPEKKIELISNQKAEISLVLCKRITIKEGNKITGYKYEFAQSFPVIASAEIK